VRKNLIFVFTRECFLQIRVIISLKLHLPFNIIIHTCLVYNIAVHNNISCNICVFHYIISSLLSSGAHSKLHYLYV